jgi:hypothetical protein
MEVRIMEVILSGPKAIDEAIIIRIVEDKAGSLLAS